MVFSSHPLYQPDPPNWQYHQHQHQQQLILYGDGNEIITTSNNTLQHDPQLQHQPQVLTGGSSRNNIRPGSMMTKVPSLELTPLKCPRCESTNTKFCYFNNYSLTQPRHFCKTCRRYWTRGGALRNVPVGGGCRRSATKLSSNKKRPKSPAVSGTATLTTTTTTTTTSTDHQNGVLQFPLYPQTGMNHMVHELGDHYIGGGNYNYGGMHTDPHIARLFQTGVMSLADSSMDHQYYWSRQLGDTTITQMLAPSSFPFSLTANLAHQEHYSSQPSGPAVYQFYQCGGQQGLTESSSLVDSVGNSSNGNAVNTSIMNRTLSTTQLTSVVKMENDKKGFRSSQGIMQAEAAVSNNSSMANGSTQFCVVGNTWRSTDVLGFTSSEPTTGQNSL